MGKTNPTYRDRLRALEDEWAPFRRALRRDYVDAFDELFGHGRAFADAAGVQNPYDVEVAFLVTVCLAQEVQINKLEQQLKHIADELNEHSS